MKRSKVTVITGHYGCGKTNFAVNLALKTVQKGFPCTVIDLDIVNPYFRTADFQTLFQEQGIKLYAPGFANSNLDIPALNIDIKGILNRNEHIIIDVGGDDAGAFALGGYAASLSAAPDFEMLYVINKYRYLTQSPEDTLQLMREIEQVSRLSCTGIVNNSNLGKDTTHNDVENSLFYAEEIARLSSLPIQYTCGKQGCMPENAPNPFIISLYVKPIWEI